MASVKQELLKWVQMLPEGCTWDEARYFIDVRAQIEAGLCDVEDGRVVSNQEAKAKMAKWRKSIIG